MIGVRSVFGVGLVAVNDKKTVIKIVVFVVIIDSSGVCFVINYM
jgi:hypothetical protein